MKEQPTVSPTDMAPMLATHGSVEKLTSVVWAFEGKWDGYRLLVDADHGELRTAFAQWPRRHRASIRSCEALAADLADHHVILDGEVVALDESGVPSFEADAEPGALHPRRVLGLRRSALDGRSLLRAKYSDRRKLLEALAQTAAG